MTAGLGAPRRHYPVAISVDALALAWARQEDAPEGATVTVDQELSARGRRGSVWVSVSGKSLAVAVVLRPAMPAVAEGLLWLLASVAAADALAEVAGLDVAVEWPNEILVDDAVIAIVKSTAQLGPGRIESAVLSLRLNTMMGAEDLPGAVRSPTVTSLAMHEVEVADNDLVEAFLRYLTRHYEGGSDDLVAAYSARCATLGQGVQVSLVRRGTVSGTATDIDDAGRLVIATPRGAGTVGIEVLERLERR